MSLLGKIVPKQVKRSVRRVVSRAKMRRLDSRDARSGPDDILLFCYVRNESLRLPFMFQHARSLGVTKFFVVDNGSSDGTQEWLLAQEDAHVFQTDQIFHRQDTWRDVILRDFGRDRWWLLMDPDEMFHFPYMESATLREFIGYMDARNFSALHCVFLDMYPGGKTTEAILKPGQNPLEISPWFDPPHFVKQHHSFVRCKPDMDYVLTGGVRTRVFGLESACSKFPLIKFRDGMFVPRGSHYIEGAAIADVWGALLHFKFTSEFRAKAERESKRGVYWMGGLEYKTYANFLSTGADLIFKNDQSMRYESPDQLLKVGCMRSSPDFERFMVKRKSDSL